MTNVNNGFRTCMECLIPKEENSNNFYKQTKTTFQSKCKICLKKIRKGKYTQYYKDRKEYFRKYKKRRYTIEKRKNYIKFRCVTNNHIKIIRYIKSGKLRKMIISLINDTPEIREINLKSINWDINEFNKKFKSISKEYHIDHKIPKSWFDLTNLDIEKLNDLRNLQLIHASKNLKKLNFYSDPISFDYYREIIPFIKRKYKSKIYYY